MPQNSVPLLRPYQAECADAVMAAKVKGLHRVLVVQPTGCGKSRTIAEVCRRVKTGDRRPVLWLAHQEELLGQAAAALRAAMPWAMVDTEQAGVHARPTADVICASMQTLGRAGSERLAWLARIGPSIIIIDEAHRGVLGGGYGAICERFGAFDQPTPRTFVCGCTATAARLDNRSLTGPHGEAIFQEQVFEYKLLTAIQEGYLAPIRGYRVESDVDLSKLKNVGGDYNQGELAKAVNVEARTASGFKHWNEVARDRVTAVFCVDRQHARDVAAYWLKQGVKTLSVDGEMDRQKRADHLRLWRAGDVQVMTSCNLLLEGFDYPAIKCVVGLRPTQSWTLYCQSIGRGTRVFDDLDLIVIDVVDNTGKHVLGKPPKRMTLSKAVGLQDELDLAGMDISTATEMMEDAAGKGIRLTEGKKVTGKEIATRLQTIELLGGAEYAPEVLTGSKLAWIKMGEGRYVLHAGTWPGGNERVCRLSQNVLGAWVMDWTEGDGQTWNWPLGNWENAPFLKADAKIMGVWRFAHSLILREGGWRKEGEQTTDKQNEFLRSLGLDERQIATLDKGKASQLIAAAIAKRTPRLGGRAGASARFEAVRNSVLRKH